MTAKSYHTGRRRRGGIALVAMAALLIGHGAVLYFGLSRALGIAFVAGVLLVAAAVHLKRFGLRTAQRRRRSRGDQRHGETAASDEP